MNTAQTTKNLAQKIARQMAQEPLEILKTARGQVTGETSATPEQTSEKESGGVQEKIAHNQQELQDKVKGGRQMEAFLRELEDIRKQNIFKELQRRIAEGEEVFLEDYPELSIEQKQVLKAQMEAVKFQKQQAEYVQSQEGFKTPVSKKGRRFGQGQKQEAEKQQTRVEKPIPPSG